MRVFYDLCQSGIAPECALTMGNFDGVHRGHKAMLAELNLQACKRGLPSCVLTFEPHPRDYFALRAGSPQAPVSRISTLEEKLAEFERLNVTQVLVLPFDEKFAKLSARAFIENVLVQRLGVRYLLVGRDFRFGVGRAGSFDTLEQAGRTWGFDAACMNDYLIQGLRVSSTLIRDALARGDTPLAEQFLGRSYRRSARPATTAALPHT